MSTLINTLDTSGTALLLQLAYACNRAGLSPSEIDWLSQGSNLVQLLPVIRRRAEIRPKLPTFEVDYSFKLRRHISLANFGVINGQINGGVLSGLLALTAPLNIDHDNVVRYEYDIWSLEGPMDDNGYPVSGPDIESDPSNPWEDAKIEHLLTYVRLFPREYPSAIGMYARGTVINFSSLECVVYAHRSDGRYTELQLQSKGSVVFKGKEFNLRVRRCLPKVA